MSAQPPLATMEWARSSVGPGARIVLVEPMPEASHANHLLVVETGAGAKLRLLLRRFTDADRLRDDAWYEPSDEIETLRTLETVSLPVPRLIAADPQPTQCDVPTLLITWLPGAPPDAVGDLETFARQLAAPLPMIHEAQPRDGFRTYEPYFRSDGHDVGDLHPPPWSRDPSIWVRVFEVVAANERVGAHRFIHRDYHHGNTLWQRQQLTGIIDWTAGCVGPPGIDIARMRINLAWDFDLLTADAFLQAWLVASGETGTHDPYWDLIDALDWLSDEPPCDEEDAARYARYEDFVERAVSELT